MRLRDDLERDLELLVSSMETKGDQIARLRRHQEKVRKFTFGGCNCKQMSMICINQARMNDTLTCNVVDLS